MATRDRQTTYPLLDVLAHHQRVTEGCAAEWLNAQRLAREPAVPMTLKVYEVNRTGTVRVLREEAEVVPLDEPEYTHQFPACECPICVGGTS